MCIILDSNNSTKFKNKDPDMQPVRKWLARKNGKIAYSNTERFKKEWKKGGMNYLDLSRNGELKLIPRHEVLEEQKKLEDGIESNDAHIIALAIVADVKVLISNDRDLCTDFKNPNLVGGKVYQNRAHAHLLTGYRCPD